MRGDCKDYSFFVTHIFRLISLDDFFFRNEPHADAEVMSTKHTLTEKDVVSAFEVEVNIF